MSANNAVVIDRKNLKVYYWGCVDNDFKVSKDNLIAEVRTENLIKNGFRILLYFYPNSLRQYQPLPPNLFHRELL